MAGPTPRGARPRLRPGPPPHARFVTAGRWENGARSDPRVPSIGTVEVTFARTGERRYGVSVTPPGQQPQWADPAPGYDADLPHDLVHYVVEAELSLTGGVFGRAAAGGGALFTPPEGVRDRREQRRHQRRRQRREEQLRRRDRAGRGDMATSEHLASICETMWKLRHGRLRQAPEWAHPDSLSGTDRTRVERVTARLDRVAPVWRGLPIGGALTFTWPDPEPRAPSPSPGRP